MSQQIEIANEAVVNKMLAAWDALDDSAVIALMDDDIICQFHEDMDAIVGKANLARALKLFFRKSTSCQITVHSRYSVGAIVVFKRKDRMEYIGKMGVSKQMEFDVTGVFWLKNGKICHWHDYAVPGGVLTNFFPEA